MHTATMDLCNSCRTCISAHTQYKVHYRNSLKVFMACRYNSFDVYTTSITRFITNLRFQFFPFKYVNLARGTSQLFIARNLSLIETCRSLTEPTRDVISVPQSRQRSDFNTFIHLARKFRLSGP
jgi:hypothetical protein